MVSTQTDFLARAESNSRQGSNLMNSFLGVSDHKIIGRFFIGFGVLALVASLFVTAAASIETVNLNKLNIVEDHDQLYQLLSAGRLGLVFASLIPILIGLAIYIVPLQVGVSNIAFPRGAAAAFWTWFLGFLLFIASYVFNGGPGGGKQDFVILWILSLGMMIVSLVWVMVCVATTLLGARAQGMSLDRAPFTSWAFLVFSVVGTVALPVFLVELLVSYLRVKYGQVPTTESAQLAILFIPYMTAPFVFWMSIPLLGFGADIIGVHTGVSVKNNKLVMLLIGFFGMATAIFGLPAFASVQAVENNAILTVGLSLMLLMSLGVFALASKGLRNLRKLTPPLFGILTAGLLLVLALDVALFDSFGSAAGFVREDLIDVNSITLRSVLESNSSSKGVIFYGGVFSLTVGAVFVGLISALHHWSTKLWGRQLKSSFGFLSIVLAAGGSAVWGIGQVISSLSGDRIRPDNILDFPTDSAYDISAFGLVAMVAAGIVFLINLASLSTSKEIGSTPSTWQGKTLEWATASPPIDKNFSVAPNVASSTPLEDDEVFAGAAKPEESLYLDSSDVPKALNSGSES